jgi:hypothetical protein
MRSDVRVNMFRANADFPPHAAKRLAMQSGPAATDDTVASLSKPCCTLHAEHGQRRLAVRQLTTFSPGAAQRCCRVALHENVLIKIVVPVRLAVNSCEETFMKFPATRGIVGLSLTLCMAHAQATLIHEDWHEAGDNLITRDTIGGLEWLNFSQTAASHQTVRDGLSTTYDGFRFATTQELLGLLLNYVPGLSPSGFMFGADAAIAADLQFVFDFLGYDDDQYRFVNTCDHAFGCKPSDFGGGIGLHRHILSVDASTSSFAIWFDNDIDFTQVQALVRVPEPGPAALFLVGLLGVFAASAYRRQA